MGVSKFKLVVLPKAIKLSASLSPPLIQFALFPEDIQAQLSCELANLLELRLQHPRNFKLFFMEFYKLRGSKL